MQQFVKRQKNINRMCSIIFKRLIQNQIQLGKLVLKNKIKIIYTVNKINTCAKLDIFFHLDIFGRQKVECISVDIDLHFTFS